MNAPDVFRLVSAQAALYAVTGIEHHASELVAA